MYQSVVTVAAFFFSDSLTLYFFSSEYLILRRECNTYDFCCFKR